MKISKGTKLIFLGVILVVIDQVSKYLVKTNMSIGEQIPVIGDWFRLCFVENEGMAFGMAFGGKVGKFCLSLFRVCLCAVLIWWIRSMTRKGNAPTGVLVGLTMITAGAFGNIIDGLFYGMIWGYAPFMFGRVVDMLYFPLCEWDWPMWMPMVGGNHFLFFQPIFNIADASLSVSVFVLILFYSRYLASPEKENKEDESDNTDNEK